MSRISIDMPSVTAQSLFPEYLPLDFNERKTNLTKLFKKPTVGSNPILHDNHSPTNTTDNSLVAEKLAAKTLSRFPGIPPKNCPPPILKKKKFPGKPPGKCPKLSQNLSLKQKFVSTVPEPPKGYKSKCVLWKPIPENKIKGSIWETFQKADKTKMFPLKKCEPNFKLEENKLLMKPRSTSFSDAVCEDSKVLHVLSSKRRQNVEICMKGLGLLDNLEPLIRTLCPNLAQSSLKSISTENLQLIIALYPTSEEIRLITDAEAIIQNDSSYTLGKVEKFMAELMKINFLKEKIECLLVQNTLEEDLTSLLSKVSRYQKCLSTLLISLQSGALRVLLYIILQMGNYLNFGTKRGLAAGFAIDTLFLLRSVKSIDEKTHLLREVVEHIESLQFCEAAFWEDLQTCLGLCQCAYLSSFEDVKTVFLQLSVKLKKVEKLLQNELQSDVNFTKSFDTFISASNLQLSHVQKLLKDVESNFYVLFNLLAHRPQNLAEGVDLLKRFNQFWKELLIIRQDLKKKKNLVDISASKKGSSTARVPTRSHTCIETRGIDPNKNGQDYLVFRYKQTVSDKNSAEKLVELFKIPLQKNADSFVPNTNKKSLSPVPAEKTRSSISTSTDSGPCSPARNSSASKNSTKTLVPALNLQNINKNSTHYHPHGTKNVIHHVNLLKPTLVTDKKPPDPSESANLSKGNVALSKKTPRNNKLKLLAYNGRDAIKSSLPNLKHPVTNLSEIKTSATPSSPQAFIARYSKAVNSRIVGS